MFVESSGQMPRPYAKAGGEHSDQETKSSATGVLMSPRIIHIQRRQVAALTPERFTAIYSA
jgi:hypothetical protein